jgi:hypothetical protein
MKAVSVRLAVRAAVGALTAGLLAAGLATVPATAATTTATTAPAARTAAHARTTAVHPAGAGAARLAMLEQRARIAAHAAGSDGTGAIAGTVVGADERPLAGACVTALGRGRSLTVTAETDGQFVLNSLRPGRYVLEYRDCGAPAKYLARWSGGVSLRSAATQLTVGTGQVRHVPGMMLLPVGAAAMLPNRASFDRMVAHAEGSGLSAAAAAATGRISGVVTGGGKKLRGICVIAFPVNGGIGYGATTAKNGTYTLRRMPPGRYDVTFAAVLCPGNTNWLQQAYPDENSPFAQGSPVTVRARHTTSGIDGNLRLGGEISGMVASASGKGLRGICVTGNGTVAGGFVGITIGSGPRGAYALHALFPGKYTVSSTIGCPSNANYAPASSKAIKIRHGRVVTGVKLVMATGSEVTGKVTAATSTGQPLAGICVAATNRTGSITGEAATNSAGTYKLVGLGSGTYQLEFAPGCNSSANYVPASATVHLTEGMVARGVNAALQVGGIISGTVTNAGGSPVGGMCIQLAGTSSSGNIPEATASDGTYQINQLSKGTYDIGFAGGCGSTGSYAPYWYDDQTDGDLATPVVLPAAGTQTVNAKLQPGATISGTVTSASGARLPDTCAVFAETPSLAELGAFLAAAPTARSGSYSIPNLAPGQYLMQFGCATGKYASQWFRGAADAGGAELVSAPAGRTTGVDAVLAPGGSITGVVTGKNGDPLAGVCVDAYSTADKTAAYETIGGPPGPLVITSSHGAYRISGLVAGRYTVLFTPCAINNRLSYVQEQWYRNKASEASATAVSVRAGATTSGINDRLAVGGTISGRVGTPAGKPLGNVCVEAYNLRRDYASGAITSRTGSYTVTGLPSATYTVEFAPCSSRVNRVAVLATAKVTAPKATKGVNATLVPGGSLSGTLTAAPSGARVQQDCVEAVSSNPANPGGGAFTGANGTYTIGGLAPGSYQVFFGDPECLLGPAGLAPQWYNDQPTQASAGSVTVTAGSTTPDIDAALQSDGEITGTVSGPSAAAPSGVCVTAVPVSGYALTDGVLSVVAVTSAGGYTLEDLLPGQYKVEFSSGCGATGYATQWWQDASSATTATPVTVNAGQDVSGISATLTG